MSQVPDPGDPVVATLLERCTFPATGTGVICAVSGGPDSVALLALAVAAGLRVTAVHVDHGLRPGSAAEADVVREVARRWGAGFRGERVRVAEGPDLESRARSARRQVIGDGALYGHTADDQAETVLLRLLRGTGPAGLAGMRAPGHPILALRRTETHELCAHLDVEPVTDPTNSDPRFRRNRVRHEVLPLLSAVAERDVVPLLSRLAELSAEQADLLDELAVTVDPTDVRDLRDRPTPIAVAALRRWWLAETGAPHPPGRAATERILEVVRGEAIACDVSDGWRVQRSAGQLRLVRGGGVGSTS